MSKQTTIPLLLTFVVLCVVAWVGTTTNVPMAYEMKHTEQAVVVTRRAIEKEQYVPMEALTYKEPSNISEVPKDAMHDANEVVGLVTVRSMKIGEVVTRRDVHLLAPFRKKIRTGPETDGVSNYDFSKPHPRLP